MSRFTLNIKWFLLGALALLFIVFVIIPCVDVINNHKEKKLDTTDPRLRVENNVLYLDNREFLRFIPIEGGTASLGYVDYHYVVHTNDEPLFLFEEKTIDGFILAETPVTLDLWEYIMGHNEPRNKEGDYVYITEMPPEAWFAFIEKLNAATGRKFRLPTKDEWEFAARGGNLSKHYKYAGSDNLDEVAYYKDNYFNEVPKGFCFDVGRMKKANELGLYDMCGGVWEITSTFRALAYSKSSGWRIAYNDLLEREKRGEVLTEDELVLKKDFLEAYVSVGGAYNSPAGECLLDNEPDSKKETGARLVLEY